MTCLHCVRGGDGGTGGAGGRGGCETTAGDTALIAEPASWSTRSLTVW